MRRTVSRVLLVALAAAALVAAVRVSSGGDPAAVVDLRDLRSEALAHAAFAVDAPVRVAVDAVGSFEERPDTALAAFGWIVRRADGALVWRQRPGPARRARLRLGTARHARARAGHLRRLLRERTATRTCEAPPPRRPSSVTDRLRDALSRGGRAWVGDAERWRLTATAA